MTNLNPKSIYVICEQDKSFIEYPGMVYCCSLTYTFATFNGNVNNFTYWFEILLIQ